ncbi:hypothetical protein FZ934_15460 [Rhizobium grahamii]|uniref:Uncharacterized protein n=1 Tax=Rhizobium grahamii TaxID=1120045 RepID=A0A5Q0CF73_9HYPH|nr:hypothetical protein FZ934_15460 [Rhizobium grahamii]QRM51330.1 hypothetical protein F3Y33_07435 [Rhizobium sp. BG6]
MEWALLKGQNAVFSRLCLDSRRFFLFTAAQSATSFKTRATDRDPQRYKSIPEVHTRQRDAPSGAFWLCVLFSSRKSTRFPSSRKSQGRADV